MASGTLYTYPENFRAYKILAAANISGFNLKVDANFKYGETNRTEEFLRKFPLGKVPAFESSNGLCLNQSNAIAYLVANEQLLGGSQEAKAQVTQWMNFADQEILPAVCTWVFPCLGVMQYNKQNTDKAKEEIKAVLQVLNNWLATRTFLVGERVTLADLSVSTTLLLAYQHVLEPEFRAAYGHVNRWFVTVVNQPQVKSALPEFKLCEKMAQFDAKLYAEVSGAGNKQKAAAEKKEKKPKEPAAPKTPKKEEEKPKPKEEAPQQEDVDEDGMPVEKKAKDPFLQFPAGEKFIMDEWKKKYSNEDTKTIAIPWFWEHFDPENWSVWLGKYIDNSYLSSVSFMNMNLIGGMIQRLDGMRKHAFGVHVYFEEPHKTLTALYISRGPALPFSLADDFNVDAESYTWTKLDYNDEKTKKIINEYWLWEGDFDGFKFFDARVFK